MQRAYWLSANVIKAAEDKTNPGAFVASPTDPWGQSVPAQQTDPGWTYREVFARDSYETFTGLLADGDRASARDMVSFLFDRVQQPDGSFPRDSLLTGAVAPGHVRAVGDRRGRLSPADGVAGGLCRRRRLLPRSRPSRRGLHRRSRTRPPGRNAGRSTPATRRRRSPPRSPGWWRPAGLAQDAGDPARAHVYLATADDYQRNVKRWTVTTTGPDAGHRYFIRLSRTGNPNVADPYDLGNGSLTNVDQRSVIDAGFLELTRLGELPATDADVQRSLGVVDSVLERQTASGPGWHRYGDPGARQHRRLRRLLHAGSDRLLADRRTLVPPRRRLGAPVADPRRRTGRAGSAERTRRGAAGLALDMQRMSWGLGMMPEQAWEDPNAPASPYGSDPATASIGFVNGQAAGSAAPLIWAQAQYLRLVRDLQTGTVLDQPAITRTRYVTNGPPAVVPLSITAPAPGAITPAGTTR